MSIGILFDLDGTLLNTREDLLDATNAALRHFGCPERTLEELRSFVGNGARRLMECAVPEGEDPGKAYALFQGIYAANCQNQTAPYAGIPEALDRIAGNYPVAIVSNKPHPAVKELCGKWFPRFYARGEGPLCRRKPDADMVLQTMAHLGVQSCIYVGDSEVDILTARNAGVPCLSVLWGFRGKDELEAAGGTHFCENPSQLEEKIKEILYGK